MLPEISGTITFESYMLFWTEQTTSLHFGNHRITDNIQLRHFVSTGMHNRHMCKLISHLCIHVNTPGFPFSLLNRINSQTLQRSFSLTTLLPATQTDNTLLMIINVLSNSITNSINLPSAQKEHHKWFIDEVKSTSTLNITVVSVSSLWLQHNDLSDPVSLC